MKALKDLLTLVLFAGMIIGSVYLFMIAFDEHIAIQNQKEVEYQHYIYEESLK